MTEPAQHSEQLRERLDVLWRAESRRVLATLLRLLGDFDLAEEALGAAFAAALEDWPRVGEPANPRAWLISSGRHRALDALRRRARLDASLMQLVERVDRAEDALECDEIEDERLRLVFACCHPLLPAESQIALTLREVCGLSTEQVASALLSRTATVAQRIVRAKSKLSAARASFAIPSREQLPARLNAVLNVVYLVFNEGYCASSGGQIVRVDLACEALRLGRLLAQLCPEPEVEGLLALMLLHDSRRAARTNAAGELVLIEDQDRSLWNRAQIAEGVARVERALASRRLGAYVLQAAIAAAHAEASSSSETDWEEIVALYELLVVATPSPVVELNRAMAIAMHAGCERGLELVDALLARGELDDYHLAHAARADLCRRLGRVEPARASYERALTLARQAPEQRFFQMRLRELDSRA